MLKDALIELYTRDLEKLKTEIGAYQTEAALWTTSSEISNSAGNLCLHLLGNLNHFVGATLGDSVYVRDREREFDTKNVPRENLIGEIEKTKIVVAETLRKLPAEKFEEDFPLEMFGKMHKIDFMLIHLLTHLNYHLGQINYHRRLTA